jgi:hypothetical protein
MKKDLPETVKTSEKKDINSTTCKRCGIKIIKDEMCSSCFANIFERKVVKNLKIAIKCNNWVIIDPFAYKIISSLVRKPVSISELPPKIRFKNTKHTTKFINKQAAPITISTDTVDEFIEVSLANLFRNKKIDKTHNNSVRVFSNITDDDLIRYAGLKGLAKNLNDSDIKCMLHTLEAKYPGTLHAARYSLETIDVLK